jgi:predicted membrane-bound spermidine synthase
MFAVRSALLLVSLVTLLFEILLTRIFSVTMWYHFAFMAISVAMFGMTLGALHVYLKPARYLQERLSIDLAMLALALGWACVVSVLAHAFAPFADLTEGLAPLTYTFALSAPPFVISGIFVCLVLTRYPDDVGCLYAADLVGGASGCLALIVALKFVDAISAGFVCGALAAGAAVVLVWHQSGVRRSAAVASVGALSAVVLWAAFMNHQQGVSPFPLRSIKGAPVRSVEFERWNSFSRIAVSERTPSDSVAWSLSSEYHGPIDVRVDWLQIDGWAGTPLMRFDGDFAPIEFLRYDITNFVHHIVTDASVAIIGTGGGRDILGARLFNQRRIVAVEMNENIVDTVNRRFGAFTGHLDRDPRVTIVSDEARSYLARQGEQFDIVQLSFIDTWAATAAGAFVLSENSLYTVEGWRVFLERLSDRGLLAVSRGTVPTEMRRLVGLARGALTSLGVAHPARHIAVIANLHPRRPESWGEMALVLVGRQPLSKETVATIERTAARLGFTVLLAPGFSADETLATLATGDGLEAFERRSPLNYAPPTDDSPFFFNVLRPRDWLMQGLAVAAVNVTPDVNMAAEVNMHAVSVLMNVLILVTMLTFTCIVLPLLVHRRVEWPLGAGALLVFFAAIGIGFMLVEVSAMQRLIIFLGHPVYGLTVILLSLFLGGGCGAFVSSLLPDRELPRLGRAAMAGLPVTLSLAGAATSWIVRALGASSTPVRVTASAAILVVMGMFMGMAFPLGMRAAGRRLAQLRPWFWAINGATSVLASVVAVVIAMASGISTSYWSGVGAYVVSFAAFFAATAPSGPRMGAV